MKDYRGRLVGKELRTGSDDTLYAATPPPEALRAIGSYAAKYGPDDAEGGHRGYSGLNRVMLNELRRAHFYAAARRDLYIELPPEDEKGHKGLLGKLKLSLYGTRDAATNSQETVASHSICLGYPGEKAHVFVHRERGLLTVVHGDDCVMAGTQVQLDMLEGNLALRYEINTQRLQPTNGDLVEGMVLARIRRWTRQGWQLEADPRHCELIMEQLQLQTERPLSSRYADDDSKDDEGGNDDLTGQNITVFRGIAVRMNHLSLGRPDLIFTAKEACRDMSRPSVSYVAKLRRIGRCLHGRPRLVRFYTYQHVPEVLHIHSDSNWAACRGSRKSTSGRIATLGTHSLTCRA